MIKINKIKNIKYVLEEIDREPYNPLAWKRVSAIPHSRRNEEKDVAGSIVCQLTDDIFSLEERIGLTALGISFETSNSIYIDLTTPIRKSCFFFEVIAYSDHCFLDSLKIAVL